MKKFVFSLFVVLSIGMVISCSDSAIEESGGEGWNDSSKTELGSLTSMYTEFINSFENTSTRGLGKISMSYPDYFGGAYVKDNKIIVFLKNGIDKEEAKKELSSRIDLGYVEFRECDYSYAELMNLDEWLFDFFTKDGNKSFLNSLGVDGWSINKDKNRILIRLRECSDFYVSEFKSKVINSPMISFEKSRGRLKRTSNL